MIARGSNRRFVTNARAGEAIPACGCVVSVAPSPTPLVVSVSATKGISVFPNDQRKYQETNVTFL